jgi:gas vesicle protein
MALILLEMRTTNGACRRRHTHKKSRRSMNDRTTYSTGMFCFLAGGLLGASVALLLAPQSGQATREAMRRKLHEADDSALELKDRVVRGGREVRDETARRVGAAASALAGNGADQVASL